MALPSGLKTEEALEYIAARLYAIETLLAEIYPTFVKSDLTPLFAAEVDSSTLPIAGKDLLKSSLVAHKNKLPKKS